MNLLADRHGDEDSERVLEELEKIDDDCDKHGIQFVKIDDKKAAKEYGIDEIPGIVYFEKQLPNVYDGNSRQLSILLILKNNGDTRDTHNL